MSNRTEEQYGQARPNQPVYGYDVDGQANRYDEHEHLYRAAHTWTDDAAVQQPEATAIFTADMQDCDAQREERNRRLGIKTRDPEPEQYVEQKTYQRTTDKWHGALAFFLLRVVTAAVVGYHGWQRLMHMHGDAGTRAIFTNSLLPKPHLWAWGVTIAELSIAVMLLLGLGVRLAGAALVAVETVMLAFLIWGKGAVFPAGQNFFVGEFELLLAVVGLVFVFLGAGGVAFDAAFRRNYALRKARRDAGDF